MPDADPSREASDEEASAEDGDLPEAVVERAERLTRLAREAVDDAEAEAYREERADLLADHDFTARVRADDAGETLVVHPDDWVDGDMIRPERVEDTSRAVEVSLSGPGEPEEWVAVEEHNRRVVARVREDHGDVHGDNAAAFADFMGNHYARPVESATDDEVEEFLAEYFPRNAWPSDDQRAIVEESLDYVFEIASEK
ncbi:DUF7108 family protein [Halorussus halobius]|uniref:DUF7108 family protein n=1 Tax=Halorussus halobius TaxID=1710537 RepID=UPI001091FBEE|nr:rnhA operon protein [Halorussus halobius]